MVSAAKNGWRGSGPLEVSASDAGLNDAFPSCFFGICACFPYLCSTENWRMISD